MNSNFNNWDTSNITDFSNMLRNAGSYNQDLSSWDTSSAESFSGMFAGASSFNQNINSWNTSNVKSTALMFFQAYKYNQPLGNWDLSNVIDSTNMFNEARLFNQDISTWRLPKLTRADFMFFRASSFNQDVSAWDVDSLEQATAMFTESNLSYENYDALLAGWSQDNIKTGVSITSTEAVYCNSYFNRAYLVGTKKWTITDKGFDSSLCNPTDIYLVDQTDPSVNEKEQGAIIGTLASVDADNDQDHAYSLTCSGVYLDSAFFTINGADLTTATTLDFSSPQDVNEDNIYDICVVSKDKNGFSIKKEFSVRIVDVEEPVVVVDNDQNPVDTPVDEVVVEGGLVLGTSTDKTPPASSSDPASSAGSVLGDSEVLATTGIGTAAIVAIGAIIIALTAYVSLVLRTNKIYKL